MRLSSLRKLADTRSFDGRTTLLHYLVALLSQSAPEVSSLCFASCGAWLGCVEGRPLCLECHSVLKFPALCVPSLSYQWQARAEEVLAAPFGAPITH